MEGFYVVLGTVLGFLLGLFGSEVKTRWQRGRRKQDLINSLYREVCVNKQELESAVATAKGYSNGGGWGRPEDRQFTRNVYRAYAVDLALLPGEAQEDVIAFYTCLDDVTSIVQQADAWDQLDQSARQILHGRFLKRAEEALSRVKTAHSQLETLTSNRSG